MNCQNPESIKEEISCRQQNKSKNDWNLCDEANPDKSFLQQMVCKKDIQSVLQIGMERREKIKNGIMQVYNNISTILKLIRLQKAKKTQQSQRELAEYDKRLNELSNINTTIDVVVRRILTADPTELDNLYTQFQIANHKKTQLNADEFMEQVLKTDKPIYTENISFKKNTKHGEATESDVLFSIDNIFRRLAPDNPPQLTDTISNDFTQTPPDDDPHTAAFRRKQQNKRMRGRMLHDVVITTPQKSMLKQFSIIEDLFQTLLKEKDGTNNNEKQILHEQYTIKQTFNWISQYLNDADYYLYNPFCFQTATPPQTATLAMQQDIYCYYTLFSHIFDIPLKTEQEFNENQKDKEEFTTQGNTRQENIQEIADKLNIHVIFFLQDKYEEYDVLHQQQPINNPAVPTEISLKSFLILPQQNEPNDDNIQEKPYYIMINLHKDMAELVEYKQRKYFNRNELSPDVLECF